MCFKYEHDYDVCWDFMFFEEDVPEPEVWPATSVNDESLTFFLRRFYNIEIKDRDKFQSGLWSLLEQMHETGVIGPKAEAKGSLAPGDSVPETSELKF